ncbi:MAG TPA: prepilin-type N-terminal cleavage/methylation domain-containing protein [Thermoanaerobaculia bacterium]|nr:prepilin-type N-terminal cleavage/methylation domain-containing protein [Thermoanaerobaculia bacterium]
MRRSERGFSLAEVLAAFLILTIVLTTSLLAFLERNNRLRQASELVLAYQALANEAEFRRRIEFDQLDTSKKSFITDTEILAPLAPYGTAVRVDHKEPGVKHVTLTVRWHEGKREATLALVRVDTGGTNLW